ncbi:beta-1-3-galactosyl-O-glycosyl-glyco beta-1-6-N-acetylglucosaminyltransferase-like [Brachionus plicatilis]|uniref:Beta-1-3-galactosyl-O-glycosyl-glyco beta-1-6-N-acetylglucosaminyltransferase-like n=1 Tax=Brachionus plicatilis TaxID=10195 RepID=A0A3M7SNJ4_BRAPC|nr:beta-1-3-galactosyl-O-glycosyl-glyco beta-1-6-N-acetylglucosaminyltransferase-like [Brachionus plicatilis]
MDHAEIQKAKLLLKTISYKQFGHLDHDFPIAFSILVHSNAEQVERLIRSIYQPQNIYCIHIDTKSNQAFHDAIQSIADCFDNIFITTKTENILYGGFSRLQADINCLKDLLMLDKLIKFNKNLKNKRFVDWKYAFNLVGTEFLLRTNEELVKIFKMYNGSNEITILKTNRELHRRIKVEWVEDFQKFRLINTGRNKSAAPHGYVITYGFSTYVISKNFAKYVIFDRRAQDLLEWVRTTWAPDEIYWSTLQYNTQIYAEHGFLAKTLGSCLLCDQLVTYYVTSSKSKIVEIDEGLYAKVKHSKVTFQSYPHIEAITIKESDFLANGTDSDHEENCESVFEEVGVAICKLSLNPTKKKFSDAIFEKFSKIALEAPIAYEATQSSVKKVLSKHKNPIACPECGKLMKKRAWCKATYRKNA